MIQDAEVDKIVCSLDRGRANSALDLIIPKANTGNVQKPRTTSSFSLSSTLLQPTESILSRMVTRADIPTNSQKRVVFEYVKEDNQYSIERYDHERIAKLFDVDANRAKYTLEQIAELCPMKRKVLLYQLILRIGAFLFFTAFAYCCLWMIVLFVLNPLVLVISVFWNTHYLFPGMKLKIESWKLRRRCKPLEEFLLKENEEYYRPLKFEWRIGRYGMWIELVSLEEGKKRQRKSSIEKKESIN